ncbi:kinase-like protein [Rhizodiscina lignyota]|uniref:Kinase-like protein n=1 Tax=Rhizodiscina lignyota TaxID=1504668 RepID=A0A9P4IKC7_9PEZI|nr:kinase-like protein [Rhizodiscina lignyota]
MDDEATQPSTQQVLDPRRLGRNNSGLSENDISDVLCILHPSSPAAFRVVQQTAEKNPQHVLQNSSLGLSADNAASVDIEEQETFILAPNNQNQGPAMDLALRFSSKNIDPLLGFCFGRNPKQCDIIFDMDTSKRVSNLHFRIYINSSGVVMLEDISTNGTLVDSSHLRGKNAPKKATRMLSPGSIIQILSPNPEEALKFILRIPSREGHIEEYSRKFQEYMARIAVAEEHYRDAPIVTSNYSYGMKWDGGTEYNVTGLLGKGAFAMVYRLATTMDGQPLAAKELEKKRFVKNGQVDARLDNEMRIMKTLRHPNIVEYIDYREVANHLYIIMEYVPCGDLQRYLSRHDVLPEPSAKLMAAQILDALAYLHRKKITHRDIKPDNILIASEEPFTVKLSDFGLSKVVQNNETFLKTFCGTLLYCAPEVFPHYDTNANSKGTKRRRTGAAPKQFHSYSQSVDIWSFAAVLWFALSGNPPFEGVVDNTGKGMFDRIMATRLDASPLLSQRISPQAVDLLLKMLNTDPAQRPSEKECLEHPWLAGIALSQDIYDDDDLASIAEEEEGATGSGEDQAEAQLSQLSINGEDNDDNEDADEENEDTPADYLHPRQSKRVRADRLVPRNQLRDQLEFDSSPEISFQTSLVQDQSGNFAAVVQQPSRNPRLFGEIGQSALRSSGLLGEHTTAALEMPQHDGSTSLDTNGVGNEATAANRSLHSSFPAAASLLGAESLMRDINMVDSPGSANSLSNEPRTPKTPDFSQFSAPLSSEEPTPKPPTVTSFSRQINLPIPPSFLFNPESPNSSPIGNSKIDTMDKPAADAPDKTLLGEAALAARLPDTMHHSLDGSVADDANDEERTSAGAEDESNATPTTTAAESNTDSQFRRPATRLGKLSSTTSSRGIPQLPIILRLENRITMWGRDPSNTVVFPDPKNVHIPKRGIVIYFHALGIEKAEEEGRDWTKLEGLHTVITTGSKVGIWINGVKLRYEEGGSTNYGRLYTGDIITVCKNPLEGGATLEFVCEFYHGEAANKRPEGETFEVLKS